MGVFAETTNAGGTSFGNKAFMRLYGLKIYEDGKLVHAFVPAKSGAIGLYDEIDGNFIAAPISGFTSGGDLKDLGGEPATDAYIESDGSQFMNTGYYPNGKTRIELDYSIPTFEDTTSYVQMRLLDNNPTAQGVNTIAAAVYVAGTAQEGNYSLAMAICNRASGAALSGTWTESDPGGVGVKAKYCDSTRRTLVLDEYGKTMSVQEAGETKWYRTVSTANSNTSAWPLGLFGRTKDDKYGNSCDYPGRIRVYGLKIFEANVLVHDYRPVKQAGVVGLKDAVTGRFLSDSRKSPGAFTASADVPEIPDDPYIESDGTSAISTGVIPKPGLKVEIDYAFTDIEKPAGTSDYQQRLFGVDTTDGDIPRVCLYINASQNVSLAYGNGWIAESTGIKADFLRHTVSLGEGTDGWLYQRGPTVWAHWTKAAITNTMPAATRPMALFGNANDDAGTKFARLSKAKVYRARFWIGDTLVRDFQPRVQDGVAGFEDLAQGGFYTCAGLTASANVPAIRGETDAYVESDGTATSSVNTYYYANPKTKVEVDYQLKGYQSGVVVMGAYNCGFSCLLYCDSTSASSGGGIFQPSASDDGYNAVGLTPTLRTDCLRHTAVVDVPARSVRITAPDGTVQSAGTISKGCTKTATCPLTLFGSATDVYGAVKQPANVRVFGMKIWEKEGDVYVLKRDLKPQVKGGVVGFKDVVTGAFLTNERKTAAQALKCGGAISVVEDDPYILANGTDNQILDTGYKTKGSTRIEADFAFMSTGNYSGHQQILFGNAADKVNFNGYINGGDNFAYSCNADDVAPNKYTSLDVPSSLARKTMIIDPTAGYTYLVTQGFTNKTSAITAAVSGRTNAYTMPIFTRRNTASLGSNYPYAKLYGFRIYEDGVLQRDYVPYKGTDGVGLRDAKTGDKIFNSTAATKPLTYGGKPAVRTEFDSVPQDAKVFAGETATLTASAADAFAYQWFLDGVAIAGATGASCTAVWQKKPHQTAVYTVRAFFDVEGETVVREASATVTSMPRGAMIIIR